MDTERYDTIRFEDRKFPFVAGHSSGNSRTQALLHEAIEIKYYIAGTSTLSVNSRTITASAGDIVIINPYEIHQNIRSERGDGEYLLLILGLDILSGENCVNLRQKLIYEGIRFENHIRNAPYLPQLAEHIYEEYTNKAESWQCVVTALLTAFFQLLLRSYTAEGKSRAVDQSVLRYYSVLEPALQEIHNSYGNKLTVDDLARTCNISKFHFCRIFRQVTGQTVMEYTNQYRLRVADVLLRDTADSVEEIAAACGFASESYFCTCYKQQNGCTPMQKRAIYLKK